MIIVDSALQKLQQQDKPIRVGLVGAGFMARGIAYQIIKFTAGMRLVAICARNPEKAFKILAEAGIDDGLSVSSAGEFEDAARQGKYVVTEDAELLCSSESIDVVVEVTGAIEYGTRTVLSAIQHGKHIVLMNSEVDATIGSILKTMADKAGVVYTCAEGDQPALIMNLYRYVRQLGVTPVLCGNIKGLHDPYRNPTTQEGFAKKWGQNPVMVTSFADGSKISVEQACVANGTGMRVAKRGMLGPTLPAGTPIEKSVDIYPLDELMSGSGIVDYVVGAVPNGGVFVLGTQEDGVQKHYLNLYKVGPGPLYCFYLPYHLCHFETPITIARAALFGDAALAPKGKPYVEVITAAKKDLKAGESLDCIGGYMFYGLCENHATARRENLLPMGLAEDCVLKHDIAKDACITFDDVELPKGRVSIDLWFQQQEAFPAE